MELLAIIECFNQRFIVSNLIFDVMTMRWFNVCSAYRSLSLHPILDLRALDLRAMLTSLLS